VRVEDDVGADQVRQFVGVVVVQIVVFVVFVVACFFGPIDRDRSADLYRGRVLLVVYPRCLRDGVLSDDDAV